MSIPVSATTDLLRAESTEIAPRRRRWWQRLVRHRSAVVGLTILGLIVLAALIGPLISPYDPNLQNLITPLQPPSGAHLLGTDELGRDELTRLLVGARFSLFLGLGAVVIGLLIGVPLGAISGYFGGWTDILIQRITDVLLSFPGFLLALALVAGLGVGLRNVIISVGISSIPAFIRLTRSEALSVRERPFVEAARGLGATERRIVLRHVIPNSVAPVIVQATLQLGGAILIAAGLGFLGLGVQPPTAEWGSMLGGARNYIFTDANLATLPGLAIFISVIAFNLVGDGLRDVLDPQLG